MGPVLDTTWGRLLPGKRVLLQLAKIPFSKPLVLQEQVLVHLAMRYRSQLALMERGYLADVSMALAVRHPPICI